MFLFLLPPGWSGQACGFGHRKLWILWRMEDVLWGDMLSPPPPKPTTPPTHHPKMTPDPFMCLHQTMEVRNSDESLWLCVYTPESRKEGNQPRSAKSGEVRENSCSPPELQWFTSQSQNVFHLCCEDFRPTENSNISGEADCCWEKRATAARSKTRVVTDEVNVCASGLPLPSWLFQEMKQI